MPSFLEYLLGLSGCTPSFGGNNAALRAHFRHSLSLFFTFIIAFLFASLAGSGKYVPQRSG